VDQPLALRLILVDRQGLTGQKGVCLSIPYAAVTRFALETAGFFDADAELSLWLRGQAEPLIVSPGVV